MSWHVSRDLRLVRLLLYTHKMAMQLVRPLHFIGTLKSVLRRNYRLLVHIVKKNRKNIYEILLNAMFLQFKN